FCSTVFHKSATSLICTYLVIVVMFIGPLAAGYFAQTFFHGRDGATAVEKLGVISPFAATFALPLAMESADSSGSAAAVSVATANLPLFFGHLVWTLAY